jgi:hypothetical protein
MNSNFNKDEIVEFERYNKKLKKNVITKFPVVGGRLRLFHEDSELEEGKSGIQCEIIRYENDVAVIQAVVNLNGCLFTGIGMASKSRDSMIFPAILEMAETRAIARALRFAGYGVEYTGAEEMESVKNFEPDNKSTSSKKAEKKADPGQSEEETPANKEEAPIDEDKPLDHMEDVASPKRLVWEYLLKEFAEVDEKFLAENIKKFVDSAIEKNPESDDASVFNAIIQNEKRFLHVFSKQIGNPPAKKKDELNQEAKELKEKYEKKRKAAVDKMSVKDEKVEPSKAVEEKLKAQIYMSLPDGVKVGALNDTIDALLSDNEDRSTEDIFRIILADIDTFVQILKDHCAQNGMESGIGETDISTGLEDDSKAEETPKVSKEYVGRDGSGKEVWEKVKKEESGSEEKKVSEYSEFRAKWANLAWKQFNVFIITNADEFKKDRGEYNAAVEKYDRLKVKKEETQNLCFPYLFSYNDAKQEKLSTKDSVVPDLAKVQELSTMKQYLASFPLMCKQVEGFIGISSETTDPDEAEKFNDAFEQIYTEWEVKNNTKYTED